MSLKTPSPQPSPALAGEGVSQALWQDGWYRFAAHVPSPNFGKRPDGCTVDLVVMHSISLPPSVYGTGCVQQFFQNKLDWDAHPYFQEIKGQEVSSHFFVERDGRLTQFVSTFDRAWHAGRSHFLGRDNCNDFSIGVEMEGTPSEPFTDAQYDTLCSLLPALTLAHPIAHITSHQFIAPARKDDPGSGFDWGLVECLGFAVQI